MDVGLVCDACSALTPIGVPQCARCGAAVALDPRPRKGTPGPANKTQTPATGGQPCPKCNALVTPGHRFCHQCGARMPMPSTNFDVETRVGPTAHNSQKPGRSTLFFGGAVQSARAKLTLIRGDGEDGVSFTLAGSEHLAGRGECPISFPDDPFLSPTHANFLYVDGQLVARDMGSLNGIFVRITGKVDLIAGATILVGEQVLSIRPAPDSGDSPDHEGTYYSASMIRPASLEVVQHLRGGQTGWAFRPDGEVATLGREGNDINFPDDPFISGRHAELRIVSTASGSVLSVTDLGSRNGTFVRVSNEQVLRHGDYVFLGQQLLRVEIV
jgi:pSer/pThr/pTyr-binding forkhead associated (FHA) protein